MDKKQAEIERVLQSVKEEDRPFIRQFLQDLMGLSEGTIDTCPHCKQTVENLKQVGRSVYAQPCGHRLYQGFIPPNWKKKDDKQ